MNKIILYHYAAIFSLIGFNLTANANLIPLMLLCIVVFALCAVRFAKSVQDKDAADRERIQRHGDAHDRIGKRFEKVEKAIDKKMDKPKSNVRTGRESVPSTSKCWRKE